MILPILRYGAPELRAVNKPVETFDDELRKIIKNMIDTMYSSPGIGLAAPQVGLGIQLTTIDLSVGEDPGQLIVLCNPEIIYQEGEQKCDEGCLSLPEFSETISRPLRIKVRGRNAEGEEVEFEGDGLLARCFSHEIDHLNGVLFIDHLSPLKRSLIRNKIKKLAKAGDW